MPLLVRVPWDRRVLVELATLVLLQEASRRAGHNIQLSSSVASLNRNEGNGGWRSWDSQNALYQGWLKRLPGYNVASNPDTGLRQHMRGAAVDILNKADRIHMLAVGFKPDAAEWWHFNHPNWANMPIIRNLAAAGLNIEEIDDMPSADEVADAVERRLRKAVWLNGEAGAATDTLEQILAKTRAAAVAVDAKLPGYGKRIEDTQIAVAALPSARDNALELTEGTFLWGPDGNPVMIRTLMEISAQHARVWDVALERPTGPANADGSRPLTRAGDFIRYQQAHVDSIIAAVVANSGKPLTDTQIKALAQILANQLPKVDEQSIVDRVLAGIRAFLVRAAG